MAKKIRIFETDNISEFLEENQIKLLGELPMSKDVANISQEGNEILDKEIENIWIYWENHCGKPKLIKALEGYYGKTN